MRKWENDQARAQVVISRHQCTSISIVAIAFACIFLGGIKGCTDYNIEKLKTPVKYEQIDTYERGASTNH